MASARKWSNVAIAMESARAASKTITAITKASEGVVSCTANGYSNGDYVLITANGMFQVNDRVCRVKSVATDSFTLEGVDTTNFDTFTSGYAEKLTFGTSITTATSVSSSGGGYDFIDTTTIHANAKSQVPGLPAAATYSFDNIWDVADAGLLAMKTASDSQAKKGFKFTFGTGGQIMTFAGYVGCSLLPAGSAQQLVTTQTTITMNGTPCVFAS